jgi:hypothetical protein
MKSDLGTMNSIPSAEEHGKARNAVHTNALHITRNKQGERKRKEETSQLLFINLS